jgi:hypothetical protein
MMHTWRGWIALPAMVLLGIAGCGTSDTTEITPVDTSLTVSGLKFSLTGATLTGVSATLPTADASFAAPVITINRAPTATQSATISVSAAEPFTAVLVQPTGSASYARINLPAQTTLIGVTVLTDATSSFIATAATIAVVSGTRTSKTSAVSLQAVGN